MQESNNPLAAIVCKNLETTYCAALHRPILNRINFRVEDGEFVSLLGLNGAGKSTLLRSLVGLVPIHQGSVTIQGIPLSFRTLPQVRQTIGMLFQGGGLIPQLPAVENVLCGRLGQLSPWQTLIGFCKSDRHRALELLESLGLGALADQKTSRLSGGQQQRVAIARALIQSPKILLVDEPTSGLDVLASQQVMDTLMRLNHEGMTVVAVLHDLAIAAKYAERAIVLDQGSVIHDGSPHQLSAHFQMQA